MAELDNLNNIIEAYRQAGIDVPEQIYSLKSTAENKQSLREKGCVYILTNPCLEGIVKIGYTDRSLFDRCDELFTTGVPQPFNIFAYAITEDFKEFEAAIHKKLEKCRVHPKREFFRISAQNAFNTFIQMGTTLKVTPILYSEDGVSLLEDYERLSKSKKKQDKPNPVPKQGKPKKSKRSKYNLGSHKPVNVTFDEGKLMFNLNDGEFVKMNLYPLHVVEKYLSIFPSSVCELKKIFVDDIVLSFQKYGFIQENIEFANDMNAMSKKKRHALDHVLYDKNGVPFVVSKMWGKNSIVYLLKIVESLGWKWSYKVIKD